MEEASNEEYDEFGNYIGNDLDSNSLSSSTVSLNDESHSVSESATVAEIKNIRKVEFNDAIVLHEDKRLYQENNEVYPNAEIVMQEEDAQSIDEPIIAPVKENVFLASNQVKPLEHVYSNEFLLGLSNQPERIRNLSVLGHLHHGKTTLCDLLINSTISGPELTRKYLDTRKDEQDRLISIQSSPISLALSASNGKSYMVNIIDVPGHPDFMGEVHAALQISDGFILAVDAVEGLQLGTRMQLQVALQQLGAGSKKLNKRGIILVITKIDRLIHELKLPPIDAYLKLRHIIDQVNNELFSSLVHADFKFSPKLDNICFSSAMYGIDFSLKSFVSIYQQRFGMRNVSSELFKKNLWGDIYFDEANNTFTNDAEKGNFTFVHFVLNPIYKIFSHVIGEEPKALKPFLKSLKLNISSEDLNLDVKPLLKLVFKKFFQDFCGISDIVIQNVPSPSENCTFKLEKLYTGSLTDLHDLEMDTCSSTSPLFVQLVKLYPFKLANKHFYGDEFRTEIKDNGNKFLALGRIYSGTLKTNERIRILGERFRPGEDEEDQHSTTVSKLYLPCGRNHLPVTQLGAGCWVLLQDVEHIFTKTCTIYSGEGFRKFSVLRPLSVRNSSIVRVGVEPIKPKELPHMIEALRCVTKAYIDCNTRVEESGEHVVFGTGELFLDSVLKDMREMYSTIEIKVSDPCVSLRETVIESSVIKCFAETANKKNKLSMIAETLETGIAEDIESERLIFSTAEDSASKKKFAKYLEENYDWDVLAARSVWAFGPDSNGPNILINDILPSKDESSDILNTLKAPICQGFQWATREGPLCDEPVYSVKFKLFDIDLAAKSVDRGFGQIIPAARRAVYSSFLTALPRMMEPIYAVEILCTAEVLPNVENVLRMRRGNVIRNEAVVGSPFYLLKASLPVLDSFGFETDLRVHSRGLAFGLQVFSEWNIVPGDPLDRSIILKPLEPSRPVELARELMIKTRRRKGLGDEVSVRKYFDEGMLEYLEEHPGLKGFFNK